jgi:hypothetical protein
VFSAGPIVAIEFLLGEVYYAVLRAATIGALLGEAFSTRSVSKYYERNLAAV